MDVHHYVNVHVLGEANPEDSYRSELVRAVSQMLHQSQEGTEGTLPHTSFCYHTLYQSQLLKRFVLLLKEITQ